MVALGNASRAVLRRSSRGEAPLSTTQNTPAALRCRAGGSHDLVDERAERFDAGAGCAVADSHDRAGGEVGGGAATLRGTVEYAGDGVMAIFGAPVALEDYAFRGCLAALNIQRRRSGSPSKSKTATVWRCGRGWV